MRKVNSNAAKLVRMIIDEMPNGKEFHGWELRDLCVDKDNSLRNVYIETFLREMRAYCSNQYVLVDRSKSLYKKIGNQIIHSSIKRPELKMYETLYQQELGL